MADAKICDRCSEYYAPLDEEVGLYLTDEKLVSVTVTENDLDRISGAAASVSTTPRSATKNAKVETKDLCGDCQHALAEFWNDGGDE